MNKRHLYPIRTMQTLIVNEDLKTLLRHGETSINCEYRRLKSENSDVPSTNESEVLPDTQNTVDKEAEMLLIRKETAPAEWADFLVTHYPIEYVRDILLCLVNEYQNHYGKEATQHVLLKICAKFID
jgi:hypothetical protein